jgi:hypothetical protein
MDLLEPAGRPAGARLARARGLRPENARARTRPGRREARHPIYLSYLLALGGAALLAHSRVVAGLAGGMAALYWYAARMEERLILASPRGAEYAAYMRRVGPFWPRRAGGSGAGR